VDAPAPLVDLADPDDPDPEFVDPDFADVAAVSLPFLPVEPPSFDDPPSFFDDESDPDESAPAFSPFSPPADRLSVR
jgi:hypothetical protein